MSSSQLRERIAAMRAEACAVGELLAGQAGRMDPDELFAVTGELQGVLNATDGAQLVATAHAAAHETRLTDRGPVMVHHDLGFVDAMAPSEVSLATGTGQWAAGRRVSLAASLGERFPRLLGAVMSGDVCSATAGKVVTACDGLDADACAAVEAVVVDRLADLDPARVTTVTRRVATRVAADQVRAAQTRNRRDRCVEVRPGPDGTTSWWAQLPAGRSAAAWSAITTLAHTYGQQDPSLTADQARADAFLDLLLTNVEVTAQVILGIPVITNQGPDAHPGAHPGPTAPTAPTVPEPSTEDAADPASSAGAASESEGAQRTDRDGAGAGPDGSAFGMERASGDGHDDDDRDCAAPAACGEHRPPAVGGQGLGSDFSISAALFGCELPGIGFIDADTIEALLSTVPLEVGRALLDARTGTLLETTSTAYRPPKRITDFVNTRDGTCRMWGCDRPAIACDTDHARSWPAGPTSPANLGGLCRRHHRLKQRRRWAYRLHPDGTATWTSPNGLRRTTLPEHAVWPPPEAAPEEVTVQTGGTERPATVDPPPF